MRVATALKRLLRLDHVNVVAVEFLTTIVILIVALRRQRLVCPTVGSRPGSSTTPAGTVGLAPLDLGTWRLEIRADLRRLRRLDHGFHSADAPWPSSCSP